MYFPLDLYTASLIALPLPFPDCVKARSTCPLQASRVPSVEPPSTMIISLLPVILVNSDNTLRMLCTSLRVGMIKERTGSEIVADVFDVACLSWVRECSSMLISDFIGFPPGSVDLEERSVS